MGADLRLNIEKCIARIGIHYRPPKSPLHERTQPVTCSGGASQRTIVCILSAFLGLCQNLASATSAEGWAWPVRGETDSGCPFIRRNPDPHITDGLCQLGAARRPKLTSRRLELTGTVLRVGALLAGRWPASCLINWRLAGFAHEVARLTLYQVLRLLAAVSRFDVRFASPATLVA